MRSHPFVSLKNCHCIKKDTSHEHTHLKAQPQVHSLLEELYILYGYSSGDTDLADTCSSAILWQHDWKRLGGVGGEPLVITPDSKNSRDGKGSL